MPQQPLKLQLELIPTEHGVTLMIDGVHSGCIQDNHFLRLQELVNGKLMQLCNRASAEANKLHKGTQTNV